MMKHISLLTTLLTFWSFCSYAAPDIDKKVDRVWGQSSSRYYTFQHHRLVSSDKQRIYSVTVAQPKSIPPQAGYPVIYMLDGNAVLAHLTDSLLSEFSDRDRPVIVTIGYNTDKYFHLAARTFDYTFVSGNGQNKKYGGAEEFWQLIEQQIKPLAQNKSPINLNKQRLWGHSLGGLFVLYVLFKHPQSFQGYFSSDPSLWWHDGAIFNYESHSHKLPSTSAFDLDVVIQSSSSRRAESILAEDATRQLAKRLARKNGVVVEYQEYFSLTHGQLLAASLPVVLQRSQQVEGISRSD